MILVNEDHRRLASLKSKKISPEQKFGLKIFTFKKHRELREIISLPLYETEPQKNPLLMYIKK